MRGNLVVVLFVLCVVLLPFFFVLRGTGLLFGGDSYDEIVATEDEISVVVEDKADTLSNVITNEEFKEYVQEFTPISLPATFFGAKIQSASSQKLEYKKYGKYLPLYQITKSDDEGNIIVDEDVSSGIFPLYTFTTHDDTVIGVITGFDERDPSFGVDKSYLYLTTYSPDGKLLGQLELGSDRTDQFASDATKTTIMPENRIEQESVFKYRSGSVRRGFDRNVQWDIQSDGSIEIRGPYDEE